MKKFFISASGLDARGVGPRIMLITAPLIIASIILEIQAAPFSDIVFLKNPVAKIIGWIWLVFGTVALVATMTQFIRNFPKGKLLTKGMFACSRNPLYSCWIVFILPAIGIICSNWLFFVSAGVMCVATILLVKEEESQLLQVFGKPYFDYKKRVACILRFPW